MHVQISKLPELKQFQIIKPMDMFPSTDTQYQKCVNYIRARIITLLESVPILFADSKQKATMQQNAIQDLFSSLQQKSGQNLRGQLNKKSRGGWGLTTPKIKQEKKPMCTPPTGAVGSKMVVTKVSKQELDKLNKSE